MTGKFFHRHIDEVNVLNGHHDFQVIKENCPICNFEFSGFSKGVVKISHQISQLSDNYYFAFKPAPVLKPVTFSFSLRAPPISKKTF
jgi:hypothetical protein